MIDTFGKTISNKRKEFGISQKELANKIKKEDEQSISPQYLNDIEKDRRTPSDFILDSFSKILELDKDHLYTLLKKLPPSLENITPENLKKAIELHRKKN